MMIPFPDLIVDIKSHLQNTDNIFVPNFYNLMNRVHFGSLETSQRQQGNAVQLTEKLVIFSIIISLLQVKDWITVN
jgi:hypothetical protein